MRIPWAIASLSCALVLSGCSGVMVTSPSASNAIKGIALRGIVHGGRQPITGAALYLYQVPTTGYGAASVSLLKSVTGPVGTGTTRDTNGNYYVTTTTGGAFTITSSYTCPSASTEVYLYSVGGNANGTATNSAVGLMAALGECGNLSGSTIVTVNEVSTVAAAYALAPFATDALHISSGTSALSIQGLTNAFATVPNIIQVATGAAYSATAQLNSTGTVPQAMINTLANILAACINSTGSSSANCGTLFSNAVNNSSVAPTDTATAAINIAQHPGANVSALYALQAAEVAFLPDLPATPAPPTDFIVAIQYSGFSSPRGMAVDASGNVWVVSNAISNVMKISPLGVPIGTYTTGLAGPTGVAIAPNGNVWITNIGTEISPGVYTYNNSVTALSSSGSSVYSEITGGGITGPNWIAIDGTGNVWVTNTGNTTPSISEITGSTGVAKSPVTTGDTGGGLSVPNYIAADTSGNIWVSNSGANVISKFTGSTGVAVGTGYTAGGLDAPNGIAIDASANVWVSDYGDNDISELTSSGTSTAGPYVGGGLNEPTSIAIDGAGNIWLADYGNIGLSEFTSGGVALSPSEFNGGVSINEPDQIAVDGSGNVWIANDGNDYVTEFVGAASPVVTPIAANLATPYGTHAVNKP